MGRDHSILFACKTVAEHWLKCSGQLYVQSIKHGTQAQLASPMPTLTAAMFHV
jgi:hypothetical protein